MLAAEVDQYIAELVDQRDEVDRHQVVRNGRHREWAVVTAASVPRLCRRRSRWS